MSAVLVAGHTTTQNSPFLPQWWMKPSPILIAPTHGGMARLSCQENTSTNHAPCSLTLLMWLTPLPSCQTSDCRNFSVYIWRPAIFWDRNYFAAPPTMQPGSVVAEMLVLRPTGPGSESHPLRCWVRPMTAAHTHTHTHTCLCHQVV